MELGPGVPTPPIELAGGATDATAETHASRVTVSDSLAERLAATGAVVERGHDVLAESGRDWWPLAMTWATAGRTPALASALVRPTDAAQVSEVLAICNEERVPVTPSAGRSGVLGGSVPLFGGVQLDLCSLAGLRSVDDESLIVDVGAGTFGDHFETSCGNPTH